MRLRYNWNKFPQNAPTAHNILSMMQFTFNGVRRLTVHPNPPTPIKAHINPIMQTNELLFATWIEESLSFAFNLALSYYALFRCNIHIYLCWHWQCFSFSHRTRPSIASERRAARLTAAAKDKTAGSSRVQRPTYSCVGFICEHVCGRWMYVFMCVERTIITTNTHIVVKHGVCSPAEYAACPALPWNACEHRTVHTTIQTTPWPGMQMMQRRPSLSAVQRIRDIAFDSGKQS